MSETNSTDDYYDIPSSGFFIAISFIVCLCIIVGIVGNVGVIAYNVLMNHLKTPTTYFVVNLAISDILVCLTYFPPWLFEYVSIATGTESNHRLICKIGVTSSYTSIALSVTNLLAITVDKCIFITKPLKYPRIMTWKRAFVLLAIIWLSAIVNANVVAFNVEEATRRRLFCQYSHLGVRIVLDVLNLYVPCVGLFYLNYKIYKVAKFQRKKIRADWVTKVPPELRTSQTAARQKEHLKQLKMVKTFAIVLGVFISCIAPRVVISILMQTVCKASCVPVSVLVCTGTLMGANSVMNPFIYGSRNKEYRIAYRTFVLKLFKKY